MIKTMLLTAQLALSPIVGTNGLQPKRLANPVYGETTDYSVTYDGNEYERFIYSQDDYIYNPNGDTFDTIYLFKEGVTIEGFPQAYFSTNMRIVEYTNNCMGLFEVNQWYDEITGNQKNEYLRFLWGDNDFICMCEFFSLEPNVFHSNTWEYEVSSGQTFMIQDIEIEGVPSFGDCDVAIENAKYYCFGANPSNPNGMYTAEKWADGIAKLKAESFAPWEAPTIPNPSVYDNIYSFYYENLFANEALDDLNAEVGNNSLTMRQWLAHTATIVSISLLACALIILVIKIFKLIAGSLSDIWG